MALTSGEGGGDGSGVPGRPLPIYWHMLQVLDPTAGEWDPLFAERIVKLALWCAMHDPEHRPAMSSVFSDLQRMLRKLQMQGLEPL